MPLQIKLATTIEEQIDRLKERGMEISDENFAKDILLDIGYYRLGFYWFPLEEKYPNRDNRDHHFKDGAKFLTSYNLYIFDKKLRTILSSYLSDIEVNVRTKVIYYISNLYKDTPTWFADNRIVMSTFISQLDKKYKNEVSKNDVIKHHACRDAPIRATNEELLFPYAANQKNRFYGSSINIFKSMHYSID